MAGGIEHELAKARRDVSRALQRLERRTGGKVERVDLRRAVWVPGGPETVEASVTLAQFPEDERPLE